MLFSGRYNYILKQYAYEIPYWIFILILYVIIRYAGLTEALPEAQSYYNTILIAMVTYAAMGGALLGFLLASFRVFVFTNLFKKLSVGRSILLQAIISFIIFVLVIITIGSFHFLNVGYSIDTIRQLLTHNFTLSSIFILLGFFFYASIQFNLILETDKKLGINVLKNLLLGKYHKPQQENRIFMFMDMKNSTGIAEELGHLNYSHFLQDVFKLLTDVVIDKKAEIYQFVGDEVVLTWPSHLGYQDNNALQFFYSFQAVLEANEPYFNSKYGAVPIFKAGIHKGIVSVAEVGEISTQIAYHGDVVNTTSRIQELCNKYDTNLLVSDSFMQGMDAPLLNFQENAAEINLRGRSQPVVIYALDVAIP